ncbi:MAG: hypothetical protein HEQ39_06870 [Rhizobacter sp.]
MKRGGGINALMLVLAFGALPCTAHSSSTPDGDLAAQLAAALTCRAPVFDGRQADARVRLERIGAVVVDRQPGELPDLVYYFPSPIKVASLTVVSIRFVAGSGSFFFARSVGSSPEMRGFAQRMGAKPNPEMRWSLDGYEAMSARYVKTQPLRPGLDDIAPRFVVGQDQGDDNTFHWGCRSFDG